MQLYNHDVAIEFNATFKEIESTIKRYSKADIDVTKEQALALKIKDETETKALNCIEEGEIESVYREGDNRLRKEVMDSLEKHEPYYKMFKDASRIQRGIGQQIPQTSELTDYGKATITLLKTINNSDTRLYHKEQPIVDKIYNAAYSIIQLELIETGESSVLNWIRTDNTASSHLNSIIEKEIETFNKKNPKYPLTDVLSEEKDQKEKFPYLDKKVIIFLAMQNKKTAKKVTDSLFDIANEVATLETDQKSKNANIEEIKQSLKDISNFLKKNKIFKNIGMLLSLIALLVASKWGIDKTVKKIGHDEYRTTPEYFTTNKEIVNRQFPEYMKKIKGWEKTTLIAYSPWTREDILYGDYTRSVVEYDLTDTYLDELSDALNLDFSSITHGNPQKQTEESIPKEELYSETIIEIMRLTQNEDDVIFVPNETWQQITNILLSIIALILFSLGSIYEIKSIASKLKSSGEYKQLKKEELLKLESFMKQYHDLYQENEEYRKRFISVYERISEYASNWELDSHYKTFKMQKKEE